MPFTITITTSIDSVSFKRETAKQALETMRAFHRAGVLVVVTDSGGQALTEEELEFLSD